MAAIRQERRAIGELKPAEYNPRKRLQPGDEEYERLKRSIETFGYVDPIIINADGTVIGGHQRLFVLQDLGYAEADVAVVDLSKADEKALNVALNKISGEWDDEKLAALFADLALDDYDLTTTGFSEDEYNDISSALAESLQAELLGDPDEVPEPPKEPTSLLGDIWLLGKHRLMCGDSTDQECVNILMDGDKADMGFTDPPWNVNYGAVKEGNAQGYKPRKILNDFMGTEDFKEFMFKTFSCLNFAQKDGAMTYVVMSAQEWGNMMLTLAQNSYHWSSTIIWNKDSLVLSRKDYHTKYEPIWYGWKEGTRLCPLKDRKQSDVWDVARPKKSEEHPTMKPVELVVRAIENSSKKGNVVVDLFGGSGTTLIASEQTNRRCRMMELDPRFVDVIVKRYIEVTGKTDVVLLRGGAEIPVEDTGILN